MINKERLLAHLNAMQTISTIEGVPGINRIAFTDEDWQGRNYLIKTAERAWSKLTHR